ncbi:hypothetical protein HKO22_03065 [Peptoniphilus sp. AGMB00490]|uniref:Bro-N domain-containing protein n=1 Tax=Peptoniphilus faecalis TaxID=2731255 RepID=A0A848RFD9_9FIRM|nr:phage antirepressor KilAC domain-containing protein [Peptoniphilus faecalis]NMW84725.1 hypothetical protein [Peptoniphilus faecalis]
MNKYTYKQVANILGIAPSQVGSKARRKDFPEEFKTTVTNEQNREIQALTEEGLQLLKNEYGITDSGVNEENKTLLGNLELVKQGNFLGTVCDFYKDVSNNIYMTRSQITKALEYSSPKGIILLHQRNRKVLDKNSVRISNFKHITNSINNGNNELLQNVANLSNVENKPSHNLQPHSVLYNEDGIYEITFLSRQPKANEFRTWIRERIKEIRKYGFTTQTNEDGTHSIQAMADFLHGEEDSVGKNAFIALAKWKIQATIELKEQKDIISAQNEEIKKQQPKVKFAEQISCSNDVISVNSMAKLLHKNGINIGQNRLFAWLRENKLVMRIKENQQWNNIPTQMAIDKKILTIEEKSFIDKCGVKRISTTTKVTPKGQYYLLNKFIGKSEVAQ